MELIFATNNAHKLEEIQHMLGSGFNLLSLKDIGCTDDIPENKPTLEGNALDKARYIYSRYQKDCFADDTGLEIEALDGEPGVLSARFAGADKDAEANMRLVLKKMQDIKNREARFRTVIALILKGKEYTFEGIVEGEIISEKRGDKGFGYDPVFVPSGYSQCFAEMDMETKNTISHRARAFAKLNDFLENIAGE